MITEKKATELGKACLDEMYKASTPPISFKEILKKYGGTKKQFFLKHEILKKDYDRIKAKYQKKLGKRWAKDLAWLLLDFSPKVKECE